MKSAFTAKFFDANGKLTTAHRIPDRLPARARIRSAARVRCGRPPPENLVRLVRRGRRPPAHRISRHPAARPRARPLRPHRPRLSGSVQGNLSLVVLLHPPGCHHHVGALEQLQPCRRLRQRGNEFLQPLRLRSDRPVDARTHRRPRTRPGAARLQAFLHPARTRRPAHLRPRRTQTPYGKASSAWKLENGTLKLEAIVPPNTTATLILPGKAATELPPGRHVLQHKLP